MQVALSSELHMLAHQLNQLSKEPLSRDFTLNSLRHALREVISCFPVYRSYIAAQLTSSSAIAIMWNARLRWRDAAPGVEPSLFDFVQNMILLQYQEGVSEPSERAMPFRGQVPAGHVAGHGQGARRHGVLCLQPPAVAQRGGRRPEPVRRFS